MIIEHSNIPFTFLPTPTLQQQQNQKRKRETCKSQIMNPSSFQLQPKTPPHKIQSMKPGSTCYHCSQQGHWFRDCPFKSQNKNNIYNHKSPTSSVQIYCRCGHGFCVVKVSGSSRNPGREFFVCPIKRGAPCEFFKWCDEQIAESYFQPTLLKYPLCECGAGVCKKLINYFVCPIKKGHGSCGFRVSVEELLNNINTSIVPLDEILEGSQNDTIYNDLVEGGDLILTTKKMRIVDNLENHSAAVAVSDTPMVKEGESPIKDVNSQHIGFPDLKFDDDDDDDFTQVPLEAIVDKASVPTCLSTPSSISNRQSLFKSDMDSCPTQSSKFPQPRPVFSCIFPSFDSIVVPEQAGTPNSDQFSTITHVEASKDLISPNKSPISKTPIHREVVLFTQKRLLNDLENLDPHQHESMREAATATFELLDRLGFECKQFSGHIWDFNLVSSMAEVDKSIESSPTLEEHNKLLEEEKAKFAHIQDDYIKTKASFEAFNQERKTLSEEVHRIEAMLREKRKELKSCELETVKIETRLCDLKRNMLDADTTLKDRGGQAEAARKKSADRRTKHIAAETTLEMAKWELQNK